MRARERADRDADLLRRELRAAARRRRASTACWSAIRSAWWSRASTRPCRSRSTKWRITRAASRAAVSAAWLIADMPFGSYQAGAASRRSTAPCELMQAGAQDGQARGRRVARADGRLPGRARHSGVRTPRTDAAVGARARRLSHPGARATPTADRLLADAQRARRRRRRACWCSN